MSTPTQESPSRPPLRLLPATSFVVADLPLVERRGSRSRLYLTWPRVDPPSALRNWRAWLRERGYRLHAGYHRPGPAGWAIIYSQRPRVPVAIMSDDRTAWLVNTPEAQRLARLCEEQTAQLIVIEGLPQ